MYENFYKLREKPFTIQPDPGFLYFGQRHSMAYAMLEYGVAHSAAFSVICGNVGCGKTTLVRHLINSLGPEIKVGVVNNTQRDTGNPLEWIMLAFGQPYEGLSPVVLYDRFQQFLDRERNASRRVLLIVDEAQNLSAVALESLRMLSNINVDRDPLLQIILAGQPQLVEMLRDPELQQLSQRISARFFISPLKPPEVAPYIRHRLAVAGRDRILFTARACDRLAEASAGVPRCINILCDTALVYGFATGSSLVDLRVVEEVLQDRVEYGFQ